MDSKKFILVIGHGRGGTSAVRAFLNLSPEINIAFEENQMILQNDNPKVYTGDDKFSWDSELAMRTLDPMYNGNKIALGQYYMSAEMIIECIKLGVIIVNTVWSLFKIVFVGRDKDDTIASIQARRPGASKDWATANWHRSNKEIEILKNHFRDHISVDFYDFVLKESARKRVFKYLDIPYESVWINEDLDTIGYGMKMLSLEHIKHRPIAKKTVKRVAKAVKKKYPKKKKVRKSEGNASPSRIQPNR